MAKTRAVAVSNESASARSMPISPAPGRSHGTKRRTGQASGRGPLRPVGRTRCGAFPRAPGLVRADRRLRQDALMAGALCEPLATPLIGERIRWLRYQGPEERPREAAGA